ncbi:MAG TPA: outer membrane beta-barrel family protein [Flavisolibacter sp.]|jgi:hypothetical protein|nr:outer membrane beta-barrel family protein [Flavisolibacter sp.]
MQRSTFWSCFSGLLLLLLSAFQGSAQTTELTIKVHTANKEAVPFATLSLTAFSDSASQIQRSTDSLGQVVFQVQQNTSYRLRFSAVNYQSVEKAITVKTEAITYSLLVMPADNKLNAVVVTASRPVMRQEDDKTIVDPENIAATSTNAYEILEKTPGLFVDQDGNIYLNSTTPATVYINGREQKMSAADIATMLKNLPPNAIASIEILRTPSARYDASGSGGVVNVVLRKGVRIGLTGSVTAGLNQGRYGNQFVGLNLNNNNGSVTSYLNLQVGTRNSYDQLMTDRIFATDSVLRQDAFTKYGAQNYYVGYGVAVQLSKKWELNYDGRLSYNRSDNNSRNLSLIQKISNGQTASSNLTDVNNQTKNVNINQGVNLKYKIDSAGSEWTTDLSFTYAPNNTDQFYTSGDGTLDNKLRFFSGQTNFLKKLPGKVTVETGLKATQIWFDNETDYYRMTSGTRVKDNFRTGAYTYKENINSAYLQASKNLSGFVLKVGTRMENTNMSGNQLVPRDTAFSIHRTDFFPYVYLSRSLMRIAGYDLKGYLVYRRTISRPAYEYLNPSLRFVDPYLFETGNPSLRPQFTRNYEANISVDERPIFALGLNDTKDIFTQVVYPTDSNSKVNYRTYDNLGTNKELYFRALGALPPGKRYFFVAGVQYNRNFYEGLYENKPLSFKRGSYSIFTYQTFKITPLTQLSLNGFVRFNGQQQFYELTTFGSLNMSLTQQFLNRKLVVTLSGNDLFFTNNNHFTINQGSINATGYRKSDTRRIGINLRYNFGFKKKEENNLFNLDSPESR